MSSRVRLRPAGAADASRLREWRNEAETRAASFVMAPVAWDEHVRWLDRKLADPYARLLIASDEAGAEVGFVRLDADGEDAEISVSIDRGRRGQGIGTEVIRKAAALAFAELGVRRVVAHIKLENSRSLRAFTGAGFARSSLGRDDVVELVLVSGGPAAHSAGAAEGGARPGGRHG